MAEKGRKGNIVRRILRWFFGSPVQELPPEFGNPVPSEMQVFEEREEDIAEDRHEEPAETPPTERDSTKPVRPDESLKRQ